MMHFNYQLNDGQEIWVCEACKRSHIDFILAKAWRLIGRKENDSACEHTTCGNLESHAPVAFCLHQ